VSEAADREPPQASGESDPEIADAVDDADVAAARDDHDFDELLTFIRDSRGFDFTSYKRSTLTRRIRKRMQDAHVGSYIDYRDRLETDADEYNILFNTILINVTGFFRDPEVWTFLQREVMPELVATLDPTGEIRVWSAGCSSGEEAYTLAMVFAETLGLDECVERVKIYGTDIDEEALRDARAGLYPAKALEGVPPQLRDKYFEPSGGQFAVRQDLRKRMIFGRHDITSDAPISRLHMLVCRNTLMYFNVEAQSQIVDRFHFALRDEGFLFLGKAEMLLTAGDRFETYSIRQRIFRRRHADVVPARMIAPVRLDIYPGPEPREVSRRRQLRDLVLDSTPSAIIVLSPDGTIAMVNGMARTQFGLTAHDLGRQFSELEVSYRPIELRSLIDQAQAEHRFLRASAVERRIRGDETQYFDVLIQPLSRRDGAVDGVSVTFTDTTVVTRLEHEVKQVRVDLETAYEELQSTNEELETTNEELQSSIEELETTNEELQSTNEELETTNEELQSGNEELETINEELRMRTGELDEARSFLEGVMSSVAAAVVVLDTDLRVRTWNSGAEDLWGLRAAEVAGQPFFGLDFGLPANLIRGTVTECMLAGGGSQQVEVVAVNRRGRTIKCTISCSSLGKAGNGVVLLMEERPPDENATSPSQEPA
jgi:two-component system CheB/CheR fusion protein